MTDQSPSPWSQAAYIVAAVLFVLSLAGLSKHETAKEGNAFGMVGMALALVATIWLALDAVADAGGRPGCSSRSPWPSAPHRHVAGARSSR